MRISAIVPAFNSAKYLAQAVESLICAHCSDLEVIVVDDGSTDATLEVAYGLHEQYPHTVVVHHHPDRANRGVAASRNLGMRRSSGELICFLDADDYVFPHRFDTAVPILEHDGSVDAVHELAQMVFEDDIARDRWGPGRLFGFRDAIEPDGLLQRLLRGEGWATSAILCRRSLLHRTGLFPERVRFSEDCHLWLRMAAIGRLVPGNLHEPVSAYRRHAANTFQFAMERRLDMVWAMADAYRWAVRRNLASETMAKFYTGVRNYVVNGVVVARESHRPDLAKRIVRTAISTGCGRLMADARVLRQCLSLWLRPR